VAYVSKRRSLTLTVPILDDNKNPEDVVVHKVFLLYFPFLLFFQLLNYDCLTSMIVRSGGGNLHHQILIISMFHLVTSSLQFNRKPISILLKYTIVSCGIRIMMLKFFIVVLLCLPRDVYQC